MYEALLILAAFTLVYSVIARGIERTWITGPILFTGFGLLAGPSGLGWLSPNDDPETLQSLAEMTLALVLFTDASGVNIGVLRRVRRLPIRLLAIGLPLTIVAGFGVGVPLFGELGLIEVALLATMLAPTDAALGKGVVTNPAVPVSVREGLNVESGLNDGICVPIVFLFLAITAGGDGSSAGAAAPVTTGLVLFTKTVGIGAIVGVGVTGVGVILLSVAGKRGWRSETWAKITIIALAFVCFALAQVLGGSGFIASFAGGLCYGAWTKAPGRQLLDAAEGIGDTFALLTWVLFGAAAVGPALARFDLPILVYVLASLTVVRMLPVLVATIGLGERLQERLFIGWFGPRGLASIVFVVIVTTSGIEHGERIAAIVTWTVLGSIVLHGVTATPLARWYGSASAGEVIDGESPEHA